jgi:hypothetical protein
VTDHEERAWRVLSEIVGAADKRDRRHAYLLTVFASVRADEREKCAKVADQAAKNWRDAFPDSTSVPGAVGTAVRNKIDAVEAVATSIRRRT